MRAYSLYPGTESRRWPAQTWVWRSDTVSEEQATYVSRVRVVRSGGPVREAYLPAEERPVVFSTHSEVREHYGTAPGQFPERATTLDYVVAAAAG